MMSFLFSRASFSSVSKHLKHAIEDKKNIIILGGYLIARV
jgi:hypothetical protein